MSFGERKRAVARKSKPKPNDARERLLRRVIKSKKAEHLFHFFYEIKTLTAKQRRITYGNRRRFRKVKKTRFLKHVKNAETDPHVDGAY